MKNNQKYAHYIASLAQKSILYEVSTTPKPGLVDQLNSGSHTDMDFFTFLSSSTALYKGFYECTMAGISFKNKPLTALLDKIRPIGVSCENDMFTATNGVNTHKGIIFSLGILCAAIGTLYTQYNEMSFAAELVCNKVKDMTKDLLRKDFGKIDEKKHLTYGELLFVKYRLKGIRGEVAAGFPTVLNYAIPLIRSPKYINIPKNDLFLDVLFSIMSHSQDTNIVSRGNIESLAYVQNEAINFMFSGGIKQENSKEKLNTMNKEFVEKNLSPGGSADLLAVAIFLGLVEKRYL